NGGKNSLNRLIRCVCGKKIGPDPRNFNQRVCLGRNDLLIRTFPSAYTDLSETVYINENNESYLKAQFEKLSQRDMKKYLGEMKRLADGGEMNFDGYLDKMSHLVNEGTLDPDILSKMRDAAPQLISFAKSFDPTSKEEIKILTDTSKLIYDLFGVKSEK
ncbi:DUF2713 family protein, partial [Escherichia coli]